MKKVFALVDCNCFYVSCERVFDPSARACPAVVLSNNDGCAISRSPEAKAAGIAMGAPIFKCQELVRAHHVKVFSANFVLYGDMSNRVMSVLSRFTPRMEVYSIDEAFLALEEFQHLDLQDYARNIRASVGKQTGIPVSVGVAGTKTLAKIANRHAKDHAQAGGVFCLLDESEVDRYLKQTPVREVWGIGHEKAEFLQRNGINTAFELKNAPDEWVKKHLTVVTLRTVWELRGISCLSLEETAPDKKAIGISRAFGYEVTELSQLQEAVSAYLGRAAEKLRIQKSLAGYLQVTVETNPFKNTPFYRHNAGVDISPATAYTPHLTEKAMALVARIFSPGLRYKSCGVMLTQLSPERQEQKTFFSENYQNSSRQRLMKAVDEHNRGTNSGKLFFAAEGLGKPWFMKQARRSKRFTTRWDELLEIKV